MNYIDLEGEDPMRYGIDISIEGIFQKKTGIEGAEHITNEYSYVEELEPFSLSVNGHKVQLPEELRKRIEESIISYLD